MNPKTHIIPEIILIVCLVLTTYAFAQHSSQGDIHSYIEEQDVGVMSSKPDKEYTAQFQGEWQTVTCPTDGREFQIEIDLNNPEFVKGLKKVICPYDGTTFFPRIQTLSQPRAEEPEYVTLRSPYVGREFKARIDINRLTNGETIVDPYTGKEFHFTVVQKSKYDTYATEVGWQTLQGSDGRQFRVKVPESEREQKNLFSPYDGTLVKSTSRYQQFLQEQQEQSIIEMMFSKGVPFTVSKSLKQFGYDIFPTPTKELTTNKSSEINMSLSNYYPKNLSSNTFSSVSGNGILREQAAATFESGLFSPITSIPVGPDYVIGPDDTIIVNIWGNVQESFPVTVDGEGKIILPKVGPLYVWGMKFNEVEKVITQKLLENYTSIQVGISMGRLRSIRVFVLGEVKLPGAHILSAQSSVFHALYAAGGPTKSGSMRKIKLIRNDKSEEIIDLYRILIEGDKSQEYPLMANDTVVVPPIGPVVGIAGNIKRPAIYELASTMPLNRLLEISGGINSVGYLQRIQVERVEEHERKEVLDLEFKSPADLEKASAGIHMQDGDLILIFPVSSLRHNFVTITGNIARPGDYELKEDMTIKDLIEKAGGLRPGSYLERAEISRFKDDRTREIIPLNLENLLRGDENSNPLLKEWDILTVYSKSDVKPAVFVEVEGAVNTPGVYELTDNMRISDLIFRAGGLKQHASLENAELYRAILGEQPKVLRIDLKEITNNKDKDLILQEQDQLFIREEAKWNRKRLVTLSGEVKFPGVYAAGEGETSSSLIKRAGGFTESAFLEGAVFTRESLRMAQKKVLRHFIESERMALLKEQASLSTGFSESQKEAMMRRIEYSNKQLRSLESTEVLGRMVIRLSSLDNFEGSEYDIPVEDGDTLHIPPVSSSVMVIGNVNNSISLTYKKGKAIDYYIAMAGGVTKNADKEAIYVIGANGEAKAHFVNAREIKRGDTIVVPEKFVYKTSSGVVLKDSVSTLLQIATVGLLAASLN